MSEGQRYTEQSDEYVFREPRRILYLSSVQPRGAICADDCASFGSFKHVAPDVSSVSVPVAVSLSRKLAEANMSHVVKYVSVRLRYHYR